MKALFVVLITIMVFTQGMHIASGGSTSREATDLEDFDRWGNAQNEGSNYESAPVSVSMNPNEWVEFDIDDRWNHGIIEFYLLSGAPEYRLYLDISDRNEPDNFIKIRFEATIDPEYDDNGLLTGSYPYVYKVQVTDQTPDNMRSHKNTQAATEQAFRGSSTNEQWDKFTLEIQDTDATDGTVTTMVISLNDEQEYKIDLLSNEWDLTTTEARLFDDIRWSSGTETQWFAIDDVSIDLNEPSPIEKRTFTGTGCWLLAGILIIAWYGGYLSSRKGTPYNGRSSISSSSSIDRGSK